MTANTASGVITKAYQDAQKVAVGVTPSTAQLADGLDRLNDLINLYQTQGLKLFLETEQVVPLVVGQQMYSMMPGGDVNITRPLQVKEAAYWDANGNSRPLWPISRQEWTDLTTRSLQGSVNQYFVEKLYDRLNLYLWQVPDTTAATGTVHAVLRNQATNPAIVGDATRFPIEWVMALRWGLADDLASGMPDSVVMRCAQKAQFFKEQLEAWDVEDAETYFQPDIRVGMYSRNRFR